VPPRPMSAYDHAFLTNVEGVTEVFLVRHGEQDIDHASTAGELVDPPLSERGIRQAELVGERFAGEHIDVVYSSNLKRANDTGLAIAKHHGLEVIVDSSLREIEVFRDLPRDKTPLDALGRRQLLGMRHRMQTEKKWDAYGFSESSAEFHARVVTTIEGIIAEHVGERIVIACHGGVIGTYTGHLLRLEEDMWFRPGHTAVNLVRAKGTVRAIDFIGDINHLKHADAALVSY
jgi:2,3-bisphosphoglycerate-dependent phosphoglycerate mutase